MPNVPAIWGDENTSADPLNNSDPYDTANQPQQSSPLTLDYYREKVLAFQQALNNLDVTGQRLEEMGVIAYTANDPSMIDEYESLKSEFESKRSTIGTIAEGIQLASQGINAAGVTFPSVDLPISLHGLKAGPLVIAAGVIGAALVLMEWAKGFWVTVQQVAARWQHMTAIQSLPESQRASAQESLRKTELQARQAEAAANGSPISHLANLGKWIVIGGALFLAYKILNDQHKG